MPEISGPLVKFVPSEAPQGRLRFRGYFEKEEVVTLEIDLDGGREPVVITELVVKEAWREHGFGSEALMKAEEVAREAGRKELRGLVGNSPALARWLALRGYAAVPEEPGVMAKRIG